MFHKFPHKTNPLKQLCSGSVHGRHCSTRPSLILEAAGAPSCVVGVAGGGSGRPELKKWSNVG